VFIATLTNHRKLRRSETNGAICVALLWSPEPKQTAIYKHFIARGFWFHENCSKNKKFDLYYAEYAQGTTESTSRSAY
jgi:hypothetical protein